MSFYSQSNVTGVIGTIGSGKTLFLTYQAKRALDAGVQVFANYSIKGCQSIEKLMDLKNYNNCVVLVDDIISLLDSRSSIGNRFATYLFVNVRKTGKNLFWTAQLDTGADLRLRAITNVWVYPYLIRFPTFGLRFESPSGAVISKSKITFSPEIYKSYDTLEQVEQNISLEDLRFLIRDIGLPDVFEEIASIRYNLPKQICGMLWDLLTKGKNKYAVELLDKYGFNSY